MSSMSEKSRRLKECADNAASFLRARGYEVQQINGQRITINTSVLNPPSEIQSTEVFVGKLPRDLFEDELLPPFASIGTVYKIRLMMDFSCCNRGFGYVQYKTSEEAKMAARKLKVVRFRNNAPPSGVKPSFDNKRLFFGNLPEDVTEECLMEAVAELLEGIVRIELLEKSPLKRERHAVVTFESHHAATMARRLLLPGKVTVNSRVIEVDWAKADSRSSSMEDLTETNQSTSSSSHRSTSTSSSSNIGSPTGRSILDRHPVTQPTNPRPESLYLERQYSIFKAMFDEIKYICLSRALPLNAIREYLMNVITQEYQTKLSYILDKM